MVPVADFYRKNNLKCKVLEDVDTQKKTSMKTFGVMGKIEKKLPRMHEFLMLFVHSWQKKSSSKKNIINSFFVISHLWIVFS